MTTSLSDDIDFVEIINSLDVNKKETKALLAKVNTNKGRVSSALKILKRQATIPTNEHNLVFAILGQLVADMNDNLYRVEAINSYMRREYMPYLVALDIDESFFITVLKRLGLAKRDPFKY